MGTVEHDLAVHLSEMDRQEARSSAVQAKIEDWLSDPVKLPGLLEGFMEDQCDHAELAKHLSDLLISDKRADLCDWLREQMLVYLDEDAEKAVEEDIRQGEVDRAEAAAEARDADFEHFGF
jgi:hypothetical protein